MQAILPSYQNNLRVSPCYSHLSKPSLGRRGDTAEARGKSRSEVLPALLRGGGTGCFGFEWQRQAWLRARHRGGRRHVPARAGALSSRRDITYEAYFVPSTLASLTWMSHQCHRFLLNLELSSSWELGAAARRQILLISILVP